MKELKKLDSVKVGKTEVIGGVRFGDFYDPWDVGNDDYDEDDETPYWEKNCW